VQLQGHLGITVIPCTKLLNRPSINPVIQPSHQPCLSINPSIDAAIHQSINPSIHQSINPSIRQSINPSIHQSINPSIHQSINPSIHQSIIGLREQATSASHQELVHPSSGLGRNVLGHVRPLIFHPRPQSDSCVFLEKRMVFRGT
jgi:hypothetical protein